MDSSHKKTKATVNKMSSDRRTSDWLGKQKLPNIGKQTTIAARRKSSNTSFRNMDMVEGNVSKIDFIKENKKSQKLIKDVHTIRKNIDKVINRPTCT